MMKNKILFLVVLSLLASCEIFEDYNERTYYKVEGVGYVYNEYTKEPVENAFVRVHFAFEDRGYGTVQLDNEEFISDKNGYFYVKFLKRTHKSDVAGYSITAFDTNYELSMTHAISFIVDKIKKLDSNTLNIDTLWIR
ncbi:hypothetical protein AGMMS49525_18330 [Bacteroidia bacterium]|nr:hypothetical protein AGMMS49525_18330 [Bacteroidia bacterium]